MSENAPAPAGWYPTQGGQQRYWDGAAWTEHTAPGATPGSAPPVVRRPVILDDREPNGGLTAFAWIAAVVTVGYMLPWAIACSRGKSNAVAIGLVNFLAGWTIIGWIIALVMACQAHQRFLAN